MDETLALPTEHAVQVALRTQQLLAYETGVPNVLDPLGGSYYVEALTDQLEAEAESLFAEIETIGGVVRGLEDGWFQRKIAQSAARQQWEIEQHRRVIVGVNEFVTDEESLAIPLLKIGEQVDREQRERLARVRAERDQALCDERLARLREAARSTENVFPHILECARAYCTLFEIRRALEDVFGAYREPVFF
jgi:methylmalonyl-CoA mutase N-terminal domain/subunit